MTGGAMAPSGPPGHGAPGNGTTRSEFARSNLGNQGRENITACGMQNYFPGTMHLAIRSVETISIQIGMRAIGKLKISHGATEPIISQVYITGIKSVPPRDYVDTMGLRGNLISFDRQFS